MDDLKFSRPGEPPTAFEIALLRDAAGDAPWLCVAHRLMELLGDQLGAEVMMAVLDELHGEKVSTPSRTSLMRKLARPKIIHTILDLKGREVCDREIGRIIGVSRQAVGRVVVNQQGRRLHRRAGKRRP